MSMYDKRDPRMDSTTVQKGNSVGEGTLMLVDILISENGEASVKVARSDPEMGIVNAADTSRIYARPRKILQAGDSQRYFDWLKAHEEAL